MTLFLSYKKLTQFFRFQKCSIWRLEKVMWRCKRNVINYDAKSNMVKPKENVKVILKNIWKNSVK